MIEMQTLKVAWWLRAWRYVRNWRARRHAMSYVITREEIADNLYEDLW